MKKTRVCDLFGIEYPIVQGGMIWVSGGKLAAAVSEAGALGLIGAGSMDADLLRRHIRKAKTLTEKPFGVNLPIFQPHAESMIPVILEEGVRIVFTSGGSPKKYTRTFKDAGARVAHVTSTPELAVKCADAGVDAVVVEGFEAGGHNGRDELTTFTLVPRTADLVDIPVIAAGGIGDGRGVAAAMALGAEGVQVGSRFVCAREASAHPAFQNEVLKARGDDTFLVLKSLIPVRLIRNAFRLRVEEAERAGADRETLSGLLGRGRSRLGMLEGNIEEGELEIGQVAGLIHEIQPAARIVNDLVSGARKAMESLCAP